jgi:murein DD-endopeptidase MepM/ murein hydrolase activator NlpD
MGKFSDGWCGFARAGAAMVVAGLATSCNYGPTEPAPVYYGSEGASPSWSTPSGSPYRPPLPAMSRPPVTMAPSPSRPQALVPPGPNSSMPLQITVERGDSLGRIAERYHVSQQAIIEANGLKPPYKVLSGSRLIIPGAGPSRLASGGPPAVIPLDTPAPGRAPPPTAGTPGTLTPPSAASPPAPGEPSVAEEAQAEGSRPQPGGAGADPRTHGGRFPWPVQGRIVAGYGSGPGGARNDGINIAAPRGAPIRAIEGGEVAYAGNELRGYGNLILVKHDDGWISAYAHCQELLVKKGERVRPGQVIAKVGSTGSVHEPQLHFELRRGKRPVDPREFLAPSPSAGASGGSAG